MAITAVYFMNLNIIQNSKEFHVNIQIITFSALFIFVFRFLFNALKVSLYKIRVKFTFFVKKIWFSSILANNICEGTQVLSYSSDQ